ncbi:MAG: hypothetical protein H6711_06375 [Myxococcales bacterium]|nr:hypothetical protein [Myxococcales bacterium]
MIVEDKEYSVAFESTERRVRFEGHLRLRSPRDYGAILELLRAAHQSGLGTLTLDFRNLEMLNSSGIGTIGAFLIEVRKAGRMTITILGAAAKPWQGRTLSTLKKIWPQVELIID